MSHKYDTKTLIYQNRKLTNQVAALEAKLSQYHQKEASQVLEDISNIVNKPQIYIKNETEYPIDVRVFETDNGIKEILIVDNGGDDEQS